MFNSIRYTIKQGFVQMLRNRTMSMASIFAITAMLILLGMFFAAVVNVNLAAEKAREDYEKIEVFLLDTTTKEQADAMIVNISAMAGVQAASYLSKEDALQEWKEEWGERAYLLDSLQGNPLPNSIEVVVERLEVADSVVAAIKETEGVEGVRYYKETVDKLIKITNSMQITALAMMVFLITVSVIVVSNTIKLTVIAREREIQIMKYIGATNWFIRGPFLTEGILIGIISAVIAVAVVVGGYGKAVEVIGSDIFLMLSIDMVSVEVLGENMMKIFIALGVSIGAGGSIRSMRKFLDT